MSMEPGRARAAKNARCRLFVRPKVHFCVARFFARKTHRMANGETIESYVPARLDALPWSSWHWLIVVSLGATWILDGLEVTLAGALGGILTRPETLGLTPARVGASATCYLAGAVLGALLFGYGTDRFGRKKLFFITVAVYLIGTALSAFSWNFWSYAFFRAVTGAGIGGEYAAINSAIDELIPARVRGRVDLIINGSYWVGAALGAAATLVPARSASDSNLAWMAFRFRNRRRAGPHRDFLSPLDSGESALVDDSWSQSGSGTDCRRSGTKDSGNEEFGRGQTAATVTCLSRAFERVHIHRGTKFGTRSCTSIASARFSVLC